MVCLQEAGELGSQQVAGLTDRYAVFTAKRETALLLRRGFEGLVGSLLPESSWREPLERAGKEMAFDLRNDWEANLDKTCVVLTNWKQQQVVLVAAHLKPSDATPPFMVALRRVLESFPLVVIGMDANTPAGQQKGFGRLLKDNWLYHTAKPSTELTVRKQRTSFQTQLSKLSLDAALKDWVVVYRHDWRIDLGPTAITPTLQRDSMVLLPTTFWPFDHAMVSTHLEVRATPALRLPNKKTGGQKDGEEPPLTPSSEGSFSSTGTVRSTGGSFSSISSTRLITLFDTWRRSPKEALGQALNYAQITLITSASTPACGSNSLESPRTLTPQSCSFSAQWARSKSRTVGCLGCLRRPSPCLWLWERTSSTPAPTQPPRSAVPLASPLPRSCCSCCCAISSRRSRAWTSTHGSSTRRARGC